MYPLIRLTASTCLLASLQMVEICFSKFNLLSISIPKIVTEFTHKMMESFIFKSCLFIYLFFLSVFGTYLDLLSYHSF